MLAALRKKDFDVTALPSLWARLSRLPGGKALFSRAVGLVAPYTATIDPRVQVFEPGRAVVRMKDRREVRNHLRSVHAVALVNLAEFTANLALMAALPGDARMIVLGLDVEYLKKARGPLVATATAPAPQGSAKQDLDAAVEVHDQKQELVARARVRCRVAPKRRAPAP